MDRRVLAVAAALVGLSLLASPLFLYPHPDQRELHTEVVAVGSESPGGTVLAYADLSQTDRRLFDGARGADGEVVRYGRAWTPRSLTYRPEATVQTVRKDGRYYRVVTYAVPAKPVGAERLAEFALVGLGTVVLVVAVGTRRRGWTLTPVVGSLLGAGVLAGHAGGLDALSGGFLAVLAAFATLVTLVGGDGRIDITQQPP
jgi:hypothetical protein